MPDLQYHLGLVNVQDSAKLIQSTEDPEPNKKAKELNGKAEGGSEDATVEAYDAEAPMTVDSSPQPAGGGATVGPEVTARLGLALAFVRRVLSGGDGALMRPHILRFLPPLLLLQVCCCCYCCCYCCFCRSVTDTAFAVVAAAVAFVALELKSVSCAR